MGRVVCVPEWVRRPLGLVAAVEDYLLCVRHYTGSASVLGGWTALHWFAKPEPGEVLSGPMGRRSGPVEVAVYAEMHVAGTLAAGTPYPPVAWWASRGIAAADRMPEQEWSERIRSGGELQYAYGVAGALGWLVGVLDDLEACEPTHDGVGDRLSQQDRAAYRWALRELAAYRVPARLPMVPRGVVHGAPSQS